VLAALAAAISTNRSYRRAICHVPPADAMTDVIQVSVRPELPSDRLRATNRRDDRVVSCEHRIINDGGGG